MVIPDWTSKAVIPMVRPVRPQEQALPENRSPFEATMTHVVERFAFTPQRARLIHNLIDYRNALYAAGITDGFQWINGSFVEHVETRPRPGQAPRPDDIDIITFYHLPGQQTPETDDPLSSKRNTPEVQYRRIRHTVRCEVHSRRGRSHYLLVRNVVPEKRRPRTQGLCASPPGSPKRPRCAPGT